MGLFKSLKKLVKKVVGGVKKVFKKVGKVVGKVLNSGIGKLLMVGLTVVTLGTALVAGYGAFAAGMAGSQGFVASVIEGGKAFMSSLAGAGGKKAAEGASKAGANISKEVAKKGLDATLDNALGGAVAETGAKVVGSGVVNAANTAGTVAKEASTLSKAGSAVGNAVKTGGEMLSKAGDLVKPVGSFFKDNAAITQLAGNMLSGYAQGKSAEKIQDDQDKERKRLEGLWADFDVSSLEQTTKKSNVVPIYNTPFDAAGETQGYTKQPIKTQLDQEQERVAQRGRVKLDRGSALSGIAGG